MWARLADSDDESLDPYIQEAYDILKDPYFEHQNGWFLDNCKAESQRLVNLARQLRQTRRGGR